MQTKVCPTAEKIDRGKRYFFIKKIAIYFVDLYKRLPSSIRLGLTMSYLSCRALGSNMPSCRRNVSSQFWDPAMMSVDMIDLSYAGDIPGTLQ